MSAALHGFATMPRRRAAPWRLAALADVLDLRVRSAGRRIALNGSSYLSELDTLLGGPAGDLIQADPALVDAIEAFEQQVADDLADAADLAAQDDAPPPKRRPAAVIAPEEPPKRDAGRLPGWFARHRLEREIGAFVDRAALSPEPFATAVRATVGLGKSVAARKQAVRLVDALRADGDRRAVAISIPRHDLAHEYAGALRKLAPHLAVEVWRGREALDPAAAQPGATMCADLDLMREVQAAYLEVETTACGPCSLAAVCAYQRQRRRAADVWILPHANLAYAPPKPLGRLAALVVDENPGGRLPDRERGDAGSGRDRRPRPHRRRPAGRNAPRRPTPPSG